jgi:PncC family amidohydrolase
MYISELDSLKSKIVAELKQRKKTLFTAESCTGGLICKLITDVSGASAVLKGGVVSYVNEIKMNLLGVDKQIIEKYTEVSCECAEKMAEGARNLSGADYSIATTGYASDGDGVPEGMAGVVFIALSDENGNEVSRCKFYGNRDEVRAQAAKRAMELLLKRLGRI